MSEEIKPEVVKKTQELLGKYVKRPVLTDKLLRKPPFRFLHDIVTCVIRETGFLDGVFTQEELNCDNIKDKDGKIIFLQKLIDVVKTIPGSNITARPSKIVAGREPAKTNELLQAIGKALDARLKSEQRKNVLSQKKEKKLSAKPSVTHKDDIKVKSPAEKPKEAVQERRPKDTKDVTRKKSLGQPQDLKHQKIQSNRNSEMTETVLSKDELKSRRRKSTMSKLKEETPISVPREVPDSYVPDCDNVPENEVNELEVIKTEVPIEVLESDETVLAKDKVEAETAPGVHEVARVPTGNINSRRNTENKTTDEAEPFKENVAPQDSEAVGVDLDVQVLRGKTVNSNVGNEEVDVMVPKVSAVRPKTARMGSARPMSARPAAPRIRDRGEVSQPEEVKMSAGKVNIITESDHVAEQDEAENYVVETQDGRVTEEVHSVSAPLVSSVDEGQHGYLVSQILETQKELEDRKQMATVNQDGISKKIDIEREDGVRRERDIASKEVERLQDSIQMLTRVANPLGNLMDFYQEHVDSIQRELEFWNSTKKELHMQLTREESETMVMIQPLKRQLQHIEKSIQDQRELINIVKSRIINNNLQIEKLVTGKLTQFRM